MLAWLTSTYIGKLVATAVISMVPVIELRGGIPYGVGFGLSPLAATIAAVIGNMLPIPFVLLFLNGILEWMKKREDFFGKIADWLERKAYRNQDKIEKYKALGLMILVAIPLPGTGAWTGALVAVVFGIKTRVAIPSIFMGVVIAGIIVAILSYGVKSLV